MFNWILPESLFDSTVHILIGDFFDWILMNGPFNPIKIKLKILLHQLRLYWVIEKLTRMVWGKYTN